MHISVMLRNERGWFFAGGVTVAFLPIKLQGRYGAEFTAFLIIQQSLKNGDVTEVESCKLLVRVATSSRLVYTCTVPRFIHVLLLVVNSKSVKN